MYNLTTFLVFLLLKSLVTTLKEILEGSLPCLICKWDYHCSWISWLNFVIVEYIWNWRSPLHWQLNLLDAWSRIPFWSSGFLIHVSIYCSGTITDSLCSLVFSCFSDSSSDRSCISQLFSIWSLTFVIWYRLFGFCIAFVW